MKERSQENEDKYSKQALFINNDTLTGERSKTLGDAYNTATNPGTSTKVSHKLVSFAMSLKSISEFIISNRNHVIKKTYNVSGCGFLDNMHEKIHAATKLCENDQKRKSHGHIEDFIQHQNSDLEQILEYSNCGKAFHKKTAFGTCSRVHIGEKPPEGNEYG